MHMRAVVELKAVEFIVSAAIRNVTLRKNPPKCSRLIVDIVFLRLNSFIQNLLTPLYEINLDSETLLVTAFE